MVGAHPCLMCSQEGDLDNRSYQRHTARSVCVHVRRWACMGVLVCVREYCVCTFPDSVSFPGINGLEGITTYTFKKV